MKTEDEAIREVITSARHIQEFLWGDMNHEAGLEEFKRMFRKRVQKIDSIDMSNPHWRVEMKKRLLQTAAIAVNMMVKIDRGLIFHEGTLISKPSNLPQYSNPLPETDAENFDWIADYNKWCQRKRNEIQQGAKEVLPHGLS